MTDDKENTAMKTLGALSALGKVLSFVEKVAIGIFFMLLEFTRIKQRKAEVRADTAETDLKIRDEHDKIDEEMAGKSDLDIIDIMFDDDGTGNGEG